MSHTVDTIETRYTLKDEVTSRLDRINESTLKVDRSVRGLKGSLGSADSGFGSLLANAYHLTSLLQTGFGALERVGSAGIGFFTGAAQKAMQLETLTAALTSLTGSAELAEQKLQFLRELSIPSKFTFEQLAPAGQELEAFGLRVEKVMPLIAKLGMAFSADDEHMQMLVRMFGSMASGRMPEIEALSRFGLNKAMFAQQGIRFTTEGQMLSGPMEGLDSFERIINQKYGRIFDEISGTSEARLSSLTDMWQQAMQKIGKTVLDFAMPYVDKLSSWMGFVVNSGWIEKLGGAFGQMFGGAKNADWLDRPLSLLMAVAEKLPGAFKLAGETLWEYVKEVGRLLQYQLVDLDPKLLLLKTDRAIQERMPDWTFWGHPGGKADVLRSMDEGIAQRRQAALSANPEYQSTVGERVTSMWQSWLQSSGIGPRSDEIMRGFSAYAAANKAGRMPAGAEEGPWSSGELVQMPHAMAQVAQNTKQTADNTRKALDLRRMVFGGGALGQDGITAVEMAGHRAARRSGTVDVNVQFGQAGGFERYIGDIVQAVIAEMAVRRLLPTGG